jgi:1-hydroxycarotenoid 3,4-desaturase
MCSNNPFLRGNKASTPLSDDVAHRAVEAGRYARDAPVRPDVGCAGRHFKDARLQQLFGRYATYCGSSPYAAPATLMLIAHVEARGVWLIEGGIHALAKAIAGLAEGRAQGCAPCAVAEVLAAKWPGCGVRLASGEVIPADIVICNGDPGALATGRFGPARLRAVPPIPPAKRSLSALVWYATRRTQGFDLTHHNVFFSRDYAREFREIASGPPRPSPPSMSAPSIAAQGRPIRAPPRARASASRSSSTPPPTETFTTTHPRRESDAQRP